MSHVFPTTANIYTIIDTKVGINFALYQEMSASYEDDDGETIPAHKVGQSYYHEHNISECPQEVIDAIDIIKAHLESKAKTEREAKGITFS